MTDVQFDEFVPEASSFSKKSGSFMVDTLINNGIVKNSFQANLLLLGVCIAIVIITIFIIISNKKEVRLVAPPGQMIIYPENAPPRLTPKK